MSMSHSRSPPSYGSTDRPSPLPHTSSSLSARALAVRAAHRLTSPALHPEDHLYDSALSPSSIDITPPTPAAQREGTLSPFSHPDDHPEEDSGSSTPRQGSPYLRAVGGASIRFRPPRKSIDAGRLARQRSHQAQTQTAGSSGLSTHSSIPSSPTDRRKSSTTTGKPRYRWLSQPGGGTGDEPGVDVRSRRDEEAYGHLKGGTTVTIVDYATTPVNNAPQSAAPNTSSGQSHAHRGGESPETLEEEEEEDMNVRVEFPGERLGEWLGGEGKRKMGNDGRPVGVRWIHVQGLNWEVIKTLTLHYNLHPLAVEDALRSSNSPRSKLDFYRSHLYLQLLIHHIHSSDEDAIEAALASDGANGVVIESDSELEHNPSGEWDRDHGELGTAGSAVDSGHNRIPGKRRPKKKGTLERMREAVVGKKGDKGLGMILPEGVEGVFEPSVQGTKLQGGESPYQKEAHRLTVDQLSAKYMVPIRRGILSIFMTRDGTIITLTRRRFREVVNPIYERLEDDQSLLRRSADVSMLAQAFLDIAADLAVEVTQTFEAQILNLEASVLVDPQIDTVRHLHVLSSQLIRLRRSITPLLHITSNIRDQDVARSQAASAIPVKTKERGGSVASISGQVQDPASTSSSAATSLTNLVIPEYGAVSSGPNTGGGRQAGGVPGWATPRDEPGSNRSYYPSAQGNQAKESGNQVGPATNNTTASGQPTSQGGFFSPLTKVYVGDVLDHLEMVVSSMDQFVATCDHLTDYVFNVLSFQTNESMERLSIVTVIFLPLTFISSFFGMNFIDFPEINQSVAYFWKVAAPSTFLFFVIFSFSYIRTFVETGWRRMQRWRSRKEAEGRFRRGNGLGGKGE